MEVKILKSAVGLTLAMALASGLGYAKLWSSHKSDNRSVTVVLSGQNKLGNGAVLKPGTYKMEVPLNSSNPDVAFLRNGRAVAHAKAKLVNETEKNPATEVDSTTKGNEQYVTEIRPGGWNQKLVFSMSGSASNQSTQ